MWEREDHMCVRHRQQIARTRFDPAVPCIGLTARAMPVATGIVRDGLVAAGSTLIDMSAQSRRTASLDGGKHFQMKAV